MTGHANTPFIWPSSPQVWTPNAVGSRRGSAYRRQRERPVTRLLIRKPERRRRRADRLPARITLDDPGEHRAPHKVTCGNLVEQVTVRVQRHTVSVGEAKLDARNLLRKRPLADEHVVRCRDDPDGEVVEAVSRREARVDRDPLPLELHKGAAPVVAGRRRVQGCGPMSRLELDLRVPVGDDRIGKRVAKPCWYRGNRSPRARHPHRRQRPRQRDGRWPPDWKGCRRRRTRRRLAPRPRSAPAARPIRLRNEISAAAAYFALT